MTDLLPRDWKNDPVDRPLVDDLADVLAKTCVGWEPVIGHDLAEAPEVQRVMARYRRAKGEMPDDELARRACLVLLQAARDAAGRFSRVDWSELNAVMYEAERRGWYPPHG
jgi:hypothetical protein